MKRRLWQSFAAFVIMICLCCPAAALDHADKTASFDDPFIDLRLAERAGNGIITFSADGEPSDPYADLKEQIVSQIERVYRSDGEETEFCVINTSGAELSVDDLVAVYYNALYDNPESTYYVRTGFSYYLPKGEAFAAGEEIILVPRFFEETDHDAYAAAVNRAEAACFAEGMTDFEKVLTAHDWLVTHCMYDPYIAFGEADYTTPGGQTFAEDDTVYSSYGVFVNRKAVCQGYALAFKVLMDRAGIGCCYVSSDSMYHAWNMVELDGRWYHVDCTYDDPIWRDIGDIGGQAQKEYLLQSDEMFENELDHTGWSTEFGLICKESCAMPEVFADNELPVILCGDRLCLAATRESNDVLAVFSPSSDFAESCAEYPCQSTVRYAAFWDGTVYLRGYDSLIYAVDLTADEPKSEMVFAASENSWGLEVLDEPDTGRRWLRTTYDYDTIDLWELGIEHTDETMPVVLYYPRFLKHIEDLDSRQILIRTEEINACFYLVSYTNGQMSGLSVLTPDEKGCFLLKPEMISDDADMVKLITASNGMQVLASAIELHRK